LDQSFVALEYFKCEPPRRAASPSVSLHQPGPGNQVHSQEHLRIPTFPSFVTIRNISGPVRVSYRAVLLILADIFFLLIERPPYRLPPPWCHVSRLPYK
jgi:hypothetical protein